MKKIDLLALLGNVDAKYIAEAKERADRNAQKRISLDDTCESNEVGIMDSKKYIRKKIQPIIAVAGKSVTRVHRTRRNSMILVFSFIYFSFHHCF